MSKEDRVFEALCLAGALLVHVAVADALPDHEVYEIQHLDPSDAWFYARHCGLRAATEDRLRASRRGTRFVVSDRFYEKDAECWVLRLTGSEEWIDVFVSSDSVRRVR